jgi:hypothetical protein
MEVQEVQEVIVQHGTLKLQVEVALLKQHYH